MKVKGKDPFDTVMAEACGHLASIGDNNTPPSDFLARVLKCKLILTRREALARMAEAAAAEAAAAEGEGGPPKRDTKSAAAKAAKPASGKKGAKSAPVDGPGKKPSSMVKRGDVRPQTKGMSKHLALSLNAKHSRV